MEALSKQTLQLLAQPVDAPCVSILVPLQRGSYDARAGRLELKNLVATARTRVRESLRPHETDDLLAPAEAFLVEDADWSGMGHGVGFFLSPSLSLSVVLPATVEPVVMVGDRFDVVPLLPMLSPDSEFHVLVLSRNHVKVYRGTRHTFEKMSIPGLPDNLDDELWYEKHENLLVSHGGPRLGSSSQPTNVVHGGQSWKDARKDMFDRFVQHIDKVLEPALFATAAPLVLAAVEREVSSFRLATRHPHVVGGSLFGNPDELTESDLHQRAWELVRDELLSRQKTKVIDRFAALENTTRRSTDATEIFEAAGTGRIGTLLISDAPTNATEAQPRPTGGVDDFVNTVVVETLRHGGDVEVVPAASLTDGSVAAAIFRWPETEPEG